MDNESSREAGQGDYEWGRREPRRAFCRLSPRGQTGVSQGRSGALGGGGGTVHAKARGSSRLADWHPA